MKACRVIVWAVLVAGWAGAACAEPEMAGVPKELEAMRKRYAQRRSDALRPLTEQYMRELEQLEKILTARRDLEAALMTRREREAMEKAVKAGFVEQPNCTYLAKIKEQRSRVGYGTLDASSPVTVGGDDFTKAIFAHAPSSIGYDLDGTTYRTLRGKAGIRDGSSSESVEFVILGDDTVLWREGAAGKRKPLEYEVSVAGVRRLELRVDDFGDPTADWSAWLDPQLCE